ncbi:hypothetical protein [Ferroplasma sp.]|uniref:STAS-like domain-containing protein n=1 Tax=Ferroplasma sp. TaxID=2591003 RepID=UPI00307D518C
MEFKLTKLIGIYPSTRKSCDILFDKINNMKDEKIIIDFSEVVGITHSFASQYAYHKKNSPKNVREININDNVLNMINFTNKPKKITDNEKIELKTFTL